MGVQVQLLIEPDALVVPEVRGDRGVLLGLEVLDFLAPLHQDGQGRGLHPAHGQERIVAQGEGPGGVHAHQPVGLGAALGGAVQPVVLFPGLNGAEALGDGFVGHGGNPQPGDGLVAAAFLIDVAEDQLALPPRVRGADDVAGFAGAHQPADDFVLILRLRDDLQGDGLGEDGQRVHAPLLVFFIQLVRLLEGDQMSHRPGDGVAVVEQAALAPGIAAQHPGDIPPHAGLLGNNDSGPHGTHLPSYSFSLYPIGWRKSSRCAIMAPSTMGVMVWRASA